MCPDLWDEMSQDSDMVTDAASRFLNTPLDRTKALRESAAHEAARTKAPKIILEIGDKLSLTMGTDCPYNSSPEDATHWHGDDTNAPQET